MPFLGLNGMVMVSQVTLLMRLARLYPSLDGHGNFAMGNFLGLTGIAMVSQIRMLK